MPGEGCKESWRGHAGTRVKFTGKGYVCKGMNVMGT